MRDGVEPAVTGVSGRARLRRVVYDEGRIAARVQELGQAITNSYSADDTLVVLGLLKGSFIFLADLVRAIRLPLQLDFLVVSSYGTGRASSGTINLLYEGEVEIAARHVILVEDIVDSGNTLSHLVPWLEEKGPKSLEVCALLHKRKARLECEPRWIGFEAPDEFLVGYGLDHAEDLRHLPYIGSI